MKKVNVKLLVISIFYAIFAVALLSNLIQFGMFEIIFSEYFFQYLIAFPFTASAGYFAIFGIIFAIVSIVGAVFGILKAVNVLPKKLGAKVLKKLSKIFGVFAIITSIWFAFYIFMATAPSGAPDAEDIQAMTSGIAPVIQIIIISALSKAANKNIEKLAAEEVAAPAEEVAPVEDAEVISEDVE